MVVRTNSHPRLKTQVTARRRWWRRPRLTVNAGFHPKRVLWTPAVGIFSRDSESVDGFRHKAINIEAWFTWWYVFVFTRINEGLLKSVLVFVPLHSFIFDLQQQVVVSAWLLTSTCDHWAAMAPAMLVLGAYLKHVDGGGKQRVDKHSGAVGSQYQRTDGMVELPPSAGTLLPAPVLYLPQQHPVALGACIGTCMHRLIIIAIYN